MTAWVLEYNERCLGYEERGKVVRTFWCWTTPEYAIRFARKEDAERVQNIIGAYGKAVEHVWT